MRLALVVAFIAFVGCSVPDISLDGKQCPCVEAGYVCDMLTNRCLKTNDGGMIIDTPAATQCLPAVAETEIYRYAGMFDWQHEDASWMGSATEITQESSTAMNSYTFKTSSDLTSAPNVHVISSMRTTQAGMGTPSFGIVLRAQLSLQDKSKYTCSWIPKNRELRVEATQGGNVTTIGTASVSGSAGLPSDFTMEASVTGSTLACCIREIPEARITAVNDAAMTVTMGYPGLITNRMRAAFGSFVVLKPN